MWDFPESVNIGGNDYPIVDRCDYRVVLDIIGVLNDDELTDDEKAQYALYLFYEDLTGCTDIQTAMNEMIKIINLGEEEDKTQPEKPKIMDWEHDFNLIAPPVSRVLGYSVRDPNNYTHWYDFVGAYSEIGESQFATVISIRSKKAKGKKLEKHEQEFYIQNRKMVDLPKKLTPEEQAWLDEEW